MLRPGPCEAENLTYGAHRDHGAAPRAATTAYSPYAEVRETHTGLVVLVGDRAYKEQEAGHH